MGIIGETSSLGIHFMQRTSKTQNRHHG